MESVATNRINRPKVEDQHLYLMQNEYGFIKIGRSVKPEVRRRSLEIEYKCKLQIVRLLEHQGHREESIHFVLKSYCLGGEWYKGSKRARAAVNKAFSCSVPIEWPFSYDSTKALSWLLEFRRREYFRWLRRLFYRGLSELSQSKPGNFADATICDLVLHDEGTIPKFILVDKEGCVRYKIEGSEGLFFAPNYSTDPVSASLAWPEDMRVEALEESPLLHAISGLRERYRIICAELIEN